MGFQERKRYVGARMPPSTQRAAHSGIAGAERRDDVTGLPLFLEKKTKKLQIPLDSSHPSHVENAQWDHTLRLQHAKL